MSFSQGVPDAILESSFLKRFGFLLASGYRVKNIWDRDGVPPDDGDGVELVSKGNRNYESNYQTNRLEE
ncbi:MAG: hypothetical protein KAT65_18225, partial [Methanophagales archaeon]|nr:hypothetical protein [Methanophagales archaeon]